MTSKIRTTTATIRRIIADSTIGRMLGIMPISRREMRRRSRLTKTGPNSYQVSGGPTIELVKR